MKMNSQMNVGFVSTQQPPKIIPENTHTHTNKSVQLWNWLLSNVAACRRIAWLIRLSIDFWFKVMQKKNKKWTRYTADTLNIANSVPLCIWYIVSMYQMCSREKALCCTVHRPCVSVYRVHAEAWRDTKCEWKALVVCTLYIPFLEENDDLHSDQRIANYSWSHDVGCGLVSVDTILFFRHFQYSRKLINLNSNNSAKRITQ